MHKIEADKRGGIDSQDIINKLLHTDLYKYQNVEDLFTMGLWINQEDHDHSFIEAKKIAEACERRACEMSAKTTDKEQQKWYQLYLRCQLFLAPYNFDDYLLFLEHKRTPEKQFYLPRRNVLKIIVDNLQELEERKIKFLGISLPPRIGKTTTCLFYVTWVMGRHPELASLMSGHSDTITRSFFRECMNVIKSEEYAWAEIFPNVKLESTSAEDEAINLGSAKRFPTLTCRAIEGGLEGVVEAAWLLYTDDLIRDREESLSPVRLDSKYQSYLNVLFDRKLDGCAELMVGTRWNVLDCLGRLQKLHADDPEYRFLVIPALNSKDKSNFVYKYNKGFSTEYFLNIRKTLDRNEWMAKYQGSPFKREGLCFPETELTYYNGELPDGQPDKIFAAVDVAYGGADSLSMPVCYKYGNTVYIVDVVFNNQNKDITRPLVIGMILRHKIQLIRFEANNGGHEYADIVDSILQQSGYHCNISYRFAPGKSGKVARIQQYVPEIKRYVFLDRAHRSQEYQKFMDELCDFAEIGQNPHDDAPDSMAQLVAFDEGGIGRAEPMQRPF